MSRPRGVFRELLLQALTEAPGTSRELAQRTRIGQNTTMYTLRDMVNAGEACNEQRVRRPGVCRPVPFYKLAMPGAPAEAAGAALAAAWARCSGHQATTPPPNP